MYAGKPSKACNYSEFSRRSGRESGVLLAFQKALGIQRGHAAGTGAGDGLAVHMVLHVAGGKHPGHDAQRFLEQQS